MQPYQEQSELLDPFLGWIQIKIATCQHPYFSVSKRQTLVSAGSRKLGPAAQNNGGHIILYCFCPSLHFFDASSLLALSTAADDFVEPLLAVLRTPDSHPLRRSIAYRLLYVLTKVPLLMCCGCIACRSLTPQRRPAWCSLYSTPPLSPHRVCAPGPGL